MTARWLLNLLLLALVILLGFMIRHEVNRAQTPPTLTDLVAADLLRIEIAREGEPTIRLGQSLQGWRLEEPLQIDADPARVDQLLAILSTPVHRSIPAETAALGELGLASPKLRLRLDALELAFGGIEPVSQYRYVSSDGLVHLIDDRFYHLLIAPPLDAVSRRLLPRGFVPVFGRLADVPLAAKTLTGLGDIVAERIEPLTGDPTGTPVELKLADGTTLRFLVSEDRRRWSREDVRLLYVLTNAPELTEDPDAIDPTPPAAPAAAASMRAPGLPPSDLETPPIDETDPFAPLSETADGDGYLDPEADPDAIVPGDALVGPPPEVRLTPDGQAPVRTKMRPEGMTRDGHLRGEPDKDPPSGFGQDPFAPDPGSDSAPD